MNRVLNPENKECLICKKMMLAVRRDRKYCSSICSRKASHYISFKNCLKCGVSLKNIHGHQKYCSMECYEKEKYERRKGRLLNDEFREKTNKQQRDKRKELIAFLRSYKMKLGCIDCNYASHHAALQFDHVRGEKLKNVCHCKSIESAKLEIEKCDVVCANCHHIRSFERLKEKGKTV